MAAPEAAHTRKRMRQALKAGGLDICPARLLNSLTDAAVSLIHKDRATSARIVREALDAFGPLDEDQTLRLADVIEHRAEHEPGVVTIELED